MNQFHMLMVVSALLIVADAPSSRAGAGPFDGTTFQGRIAYSCDGNFNDPDDWAASPVSLAILAEAGVKDRLVHCDYNNIIPRNNPEWERLHAESVLGAVDSYGYDRSLFHDCQQDVDAAIASIARAINASSADDPLYFILAGPMEIPVLGIEQSDADKRKFVYCISHSNWNDGFSTAARHDFFTYNKRSVIDSGVHWVQIAGQNPLLRPNPYGRDATEAEWALYHWMRDSDDPKVRFLWERMQVSMHPDPSDAGMTYFLVTGDEQADPAKLKRLLDDNVVPTPIGEREHVRLEAEDFTDMEGYQLDYRNDREASHRISAKPVGDSGTGRISTRFQQPYAAARGRYDVDLRYRDQPDQPCRFALVVNGTRQGDVFSSPGDEQGWTTHAFHDVEVSTDNVIMLEIEGAGDVDYLQFDRQRSPASGN